VTRARPARTSNSSTTQWRANLATSFDRLQATITADSGVAILVVGRPDLVTLGPWRSGPAWSTSKIPLALAALQHADSPATRALVGRAITASDNAAAEALWAELGAGPPAGAAVDAVLKAHGDPHTRTQWRRVRAGFTPFGQTPWALLDQVAFTAGLACDSGAGRVLDEMGGVVSEQRWGLGRLASARIKGGWGPDERGGYLARQLALVPRGRDLVAVAVAARAPGGFGPAVAALDEITAWLRKQLPTLPSAAHTCR